MSWKSWVIVGVAVAVMCASGGLLMASNMGFKINKALTSGFLGAQAPKGHNWISLPYTSPYANAKAFCTAAGVATNAGTATIIDPATGTLTNFLCGGAGPGFTINGAQGLRFTIAGAGVPSAVLVGASNEATQLSILDNFLGAQAPKKYNWVSVPYHTTWVKANDICVTMANATNAVTITRIDASTGGVTNHLCGQGAGGTGNFSLVIGESVRITRAGAGVITFFPPHF
jgi:hypothetical protein